MSFKKKANVRDFYSTPRNWAFFLCLTSFCLGMFFTNRMWNLPEVKLSLRTKDCNKTKVFNYGNNTIRILDKVISSLEMKLVAARAKRDSLYRKFNISGYETKRKYFMVIGINTGFSSRKRRDSIRATWMPQGENLKNLEEEKGIIIRFVIGNRILEKDIEFEEETYGDFLRLEHIEGYMEISAKTKMFFATAVSTWDAEFYIKVDDDVHVNLATLGTILTPHRSKPRVYIGCMKSGPVLSKMEPEYWKFGKKYFRHATGQFYAISKDLATYIFINRDLLRKYANEDVSLGSWFIGLNVEYVDDKRFCCSTPPDCIGKVCAASFDKKCNGICGSTERMTQVHERCGEPKNAIWTTYFLQNN